MFNICPCIGKTVRTVHQHLLRAWREAASPGFLVGWALHGAVFRKTDPVPHRAGAARLLSSPSGILFLQGPWEQCQLLKSASAFARCHPLVDPEPFVALCERTLCTCAQGLRCPCEVLLEYARACAQQGMVLYGWTDHSTCRKSTAHPPSWGQVVSVPPVTREALRLVTLLGHLITEGWPAGGRPFP